MDIHTVRRLELAGAKDAAALLGLSASALLASPVFMDVPLLGNPSFSAVFAGMGSAYLTERASILWNSAPLLKNDVVCDSSPPVIDPSDYKALVSSVLFGYTVEDGTPIHISYEDLTRHVSILGQSGVGKTVLGKFLMFQHIVNGGSLIFMDPKMKAEDLEDFYQMCAWAGRSKDLLILNPGNPCMSNTYNPILKGTPEEISARIMSLAPSTESSPGADHYKMSALQGVQTIIGGLQTTKKAFNFIDLVILLSNSAALIDLENSLLAVDPDHPNTIAYRMLLAKYKKTENGMQVINVDKLKEMFGGIAGRLFMFGTGTFGDVMNTYEPEIELFEAMTTGKIVYIQLPTMGMNDQSVMFAKMLMGDLRTAISWLQALPEHLVPKIPIWAFIDEAGSVVNESWSRPFEQGRSARLILNPAAQSLANYEAVSPQIPQMVVGNCTTKIFFRMGTQEGAEAAADFIGQKMGVTLSLTSSHSSSSSAANVQAGPEANIGDGDGTAFAERQQEEYRVHPDTLKKLGKGQCVLVFEGDKVYNLRVPLIKFTSKFISEVGPAKINHFKRQDRVGIDLHKRANEFLKEDGTPKDSGKQKAKG